ncbi:hypothetical protein [Mesorhizobium shangrilense]|uniref:Uncharacterized protein n=1 Tax=Mesorhizobium shangrilense TaxID=460060 RepID=A0ABV2DBB6_9HYPH
MASPAEKNNYYVPVHNQPDPLRLPRRIAADALDRIPEPYRAAYIEEEDPTKGFELSTRIADAIRDGEAEIASLNAELAKIQVEGPAKLATVKKQMRDDAVNETLQVALTKAGVKTELFDAALALVKRKAEFEAEKSDDGTYAVQARTPFGLATVESVVQQFVDSDEGAAYRGKRAAPSAGNSFSQLQAGLKAGR